MHLKTDLVQGRQQKNGYWKIRNLKDSKIKPGPVRKLKATKKATNQDWPDHKHKYPEYTYL